MFFQEDAESKGIRIELEDRVTQNKVWGHRELLMQCFMNIFDNCVKYSEPNSKVEINQRIQKKTGHALIEIRNRPKTLVNKDEIARFFDMGFRGSNALEVVASGTGLGLYICRRIVEEVHHGKIRIDTYRGSSLSFCLIFPEGIKES